MEKLSFFGCGPKIGRITLPYLAITITLSIIFPSVFQFGKTVQQPFLIAGIILLVISLVFYFSTLRTMLPGIKENRLITKGGYRLCRNPLYSAILFFMIPGLSMVMNSWFILTSTLIGYLVFRKYIVEEEGQLERIFGEEYLKYKRGTSQIFPLKLW
ncbi:MAG: isoprenylcysteine carboxylmethyltransferase family protein [Bacteroidetes bacterium]|nr:isoprenylcysteine carboxylmethyltransferase family protein [Bacteroidota bacterium]